MLGLLELACYIFSQYLREMFHFLSPLLICVSYLLTFDDGHAEEYL